MRLTHKLENGTYLAKTDNPNTSIETDIRNCVQKLGQLEDIEDELGIDLITIYKALKNGYYYKDEDGSIQYIDDNCLFKDIFNAIKEMAKEYNKSWALTKEELE